MIVSDIYLHKTLYFRGYSAVNYMNCWVNVGWNSDEIMVWFIEFQLYEPHEVEDMPGANSTLSNAKIALL